MIEQNNSEEVDYKFIINLVYHQPFQNEGGEMEVVAKLISFGYRSEKDADKAFKTFNKTHILEYSTDIGIISYNLLSVELIDIAKYNEKIIPVPQLEGTEPQEYQKSEESSI